MTGVSTGESRPALRKGLRVLRRAECTVQFGLDPERAVVVAAPSPAVAGLIEALDGRSGLGALARRHRLEPALVASVVAELAGLGLLQGRGPVSPAGARVIPPDVVEPGVLQPGVVQPGMVATQPASRPARGRSPRTLRRLDPVAAEHARRTEPDVAAWSLLDPDPGGFADERDRRAGATVSVCGSGRLATALTLLLASAGVGAVVAGDDSPVRHSDRLPGGLGRDDVGRPHRAGLARRLADVAPASALLAEHPRPDLVVVTDGGADRAFVAGLHRTGTTHLVLDVRETVGRVGPLVVPGRTSCLRCQHLHRVDHDPGWALVVDQLADAAPGAGGRPARSGGIPGVLGVPGPARRAVVGPSAVDACDGVLATLVAATACLHVLTWLRGQVPPSVDGTLEARLPDGTLRRRGWEPHPGCGCLSAA